MKNKFLAVLLLLFPLPVLAQVGNPSITVVQSAPSGACMNNLPDQQVATTGLLYSCQNGTWAEIGGAGTSFGPVGGTTNQIGVASGGTAPVISFATPFASAYSVTASSGNLLAVESSTYAGVPARVEIYPDATAKPDEGNASVAGTIAWAGAQLTSGGEIFVHEGAYSVATTITLGVAGTHLVCADPSSVTLTAASGLNANIVDVGFQGAQRQGMMVENCGFNGNNGQNTSGNLIEARDVANAIIQNNYLKDSVTTGITLDATTSGEVQNQIVGNFFVECVKQCLTVTSANGGDPTDSVIDRNTIGGSVIGDGTSPWVTVADIGGQQFTNNHISGPGHTYSAYFSNGSQSHVVISHNIFESSVQHGLVVSGLGFTITGNMFYLNGTGTANTYADLYLMSSSNDSITGNVFDGSSNNKYGIYSDQGTVYNTITNNTFLNHTGFAISLANAFAGGNVIGPNVYNGNGGTISAGGTHYAPIAVSLSNSPSLSAVPGQLNTNGISLTQLASGPTPTITTQGTAGGATWTYVVVPKDINGQAAPAGSSGSTTTGNATLSGSNYNVVSWAIVNGAYSYDVYRTAHGTSPTTTGFIGNVTSATAPSGNGSMFLNDTSLSGNGATAPTTNNTGSVSGLGPDASPAHVVNGTTFSVAGCGTATSLVGGATAGKFVGGSATCTPVITTGLTAPNGLACWMQDETTSTAAFRQTAYTATTVTFTAGGTVGGTDTIVFGCLEF